MGFVFFAPDHQLNSSVAPSSHLFSSTGLWNWNHGFLLFSKMWSNEWCFGNLQQASSMIYIDDMGSMGFVQVGDGDSDHNCWQRPEDMTTSREAYAVTKENPGSDLAAETAAAMAAASIAFRKIDPVYSSELLRHAREVYLTFCLFTLKFFLFFVIGTWLFCCWTQSIPFWLLVLMPAQDMHFFYCTWRLQQLSHVLVQLMIHPHFLLVSSELYCSPNVTVKSYCLAAIQVCRHIPREIRQQYTTGQEILPIPEWLQCRLSALFLWILCSDSISRIIKKLRLCFWKKKAMSRRKLLRDDSIIRYDEIQFYSLKDWVFKLVQDELLWGAIWLHEATNEEAYLQYVASNAEQMGGTVWTMNQFSWENKYVGVQLKATKVPFYCKPKIVI